MKARLHNSNADQSPPEIAGSDVGRGAPACHWRDDLAKLLVAFGCVIVCCLPLCGCGSGADQTTPKDADAGEVAVLKSEVERGPVQFTVEVSPEKPRLSDTPELRLTIRAEQGVRIEKPPFGTALGDFLIRDFNEPPPKTDGEYTVTQQIYTLEPTHAGKLAVTPILVKFFDERPAADGGEYTIESEALVVEVTTVLGASAPSLTDLRPAAGPIELPAAAGSKWMLVAGIVSGLALMAVVIIRLRNRRELQESKLTPQELAWLELEQIIQQKLAEDDVKEFYVELTGVVRRYIERSTGIHAPEQTTEEFLRQVVDEGVFADDDQQRLRSFLESADLVKFAAFEPEPSDIERSFDRAKEFIRLERREEPQELVPEVVA